MKSILVGLILVIASIGVLGAQTPSPTPVVKLTMTKVQMAEYRQAREAKDWAKCESLTVFPDVKAWDANNLAFDKFQDEDWAGAKVDYERALKYAAEADKAGRSTGMDDLRQMVKTALESIDKNLKDDSE